ncbi:hypothetical protein PWY87_09435 [Kribbella solani]|uniref:hypothetical protein n=1 Tax=Kribbella solani TaxID=236067 RepID=UPI0029B38AA1|nr:hypothetical protein [Kribbella solani]MDX3001889.1 hypothetical protein [Kribbella solani]
MGAGEFAGRDPAPLDLVQVLRSEFSSAQAAGHSSEPPGGLGGADRSYSQEAGTGGGKYPCPRWYLWATPVSSGGHGENHAAGHRPPLPDVPADPLRRHLLDQPLDGPGQAGRPIDRRRSVATDSRPAGRTRPRGRHRPAARRTAGHGLRRQQRHRVRGPRAGGPVPVPGAGRGIPYLGKLATGIEPGEILVGVAQGKQPGLAPDRRECVGIRFCYPPEDARVVEITVPAPGAVPGLLEARAMVPAGATVRLPPRAHLGRHAYVICTAADPATCADRLTAAAGLVELKYEALNETEYSGRPW